MNRSVLLFLLVFVGAMALRPLPGIGDVFGSPVLYVVVALTVAAASAWGAEISHRRRTLARGVLRLRDATSPYHQGKLGALYLAHGQARRAIPHLERAAAGEPDIVDWHFRLGQAHAKLGHARAALAAWDRAYELAPDHAFGALQLARARALGRCREWQRALDAIEEQERDYSPSPESAYRAGVLLARLGRGAEAKRRLEDVARLAARAKGHQRRRQRLWAWRAQAVRFAAALALPRMPQAAE